MQTEDQIKSIIQGDLTGFFEELLTKTAGRLEFSGSPLLIDYVAKVLTNFHVSQHFFIHPEAKLPVLADFLAEALEADIYRKISIYRQLGETSLMLSAVFKEALERKAIDVKYCYQMGETAYSYLSDLTESETVYSELCEGFVPVSQLVRQVFLGLRLADLSAVELLQHYDQNTDEAVLQTLREKGVLPFRSKDEGSR